MSVLTDKGINFLENLEPSGINVEQGMLDKATAFLEDAVLPDTRVEEWKYTRLAKLNRFKFRNPQNESIEIPEIQIDENALRITILNGQVLTDPDHPDVPEGLKINLASKTENALSNSKNATDSELFSAINLVYLDEALIIEVEAGRKIERTVEVIHVMLGRERMTNFKTIVRIGAMAEMNLVLGYFSEERCENSFLNNTFEAEVGRNATLSVDKIQIENASCFHISNDEIDQDPDSTFTINTFTLNGLLIRNNLTIRVNGQNSETHLNGLYFLKGDQHTDNHTIVDHNVPNCTSNELYRGVIDGEATAVFNGKVYVRKEAQKTNAFQSNANILLSDSATINSKPELEIYADDVKCSHGSTTGQLDEEAVFYLRSRGLSESAAKKLLISAFAAEVLEKVNNEAVRGFVEDRINERFGY